MTRETFLLIENYMKECMRDSAHDKEHIFRVLYTALEIAGTETGVDYDVLITSCLLHDIGRGEQFENPKLCHALVGADKAFEFLKSRGFETEFCEKVKHCIAAHRYRRENRPESMEAKILFDADKIDVCGAVGIARTLLYKGEVGEPLYTVNDGRVSDGTGDASPSFMQEYKYKLEGIYERFYTARGSEIARSRQAAAVGFYGALYNEVSGGYEKGPAKLEEILET